MKSIIVETGVSSEKISQRLRKDRIAKKVARAEMYQQRMKTLAKAERTQIKAQRRLSAILNRKHKEQLMTSGEMKQMYGRALPEGNDGNILHAQNLFTSSDNRERSSRTGGNILQAENLLMRTRRQSPNQKQKWI